MKASVDQNLCWALQCLRVGGYPYSELSLMFQLSEGTIAKHGSGECSHDPFPAEIQPTDPPLGDELRELREKKGLSKVELGKLLDVDPTTIYAYEREWYEPRVGNAQALVAFANGEYDEK